MLAVLLAATVLALVLPVRAVARESELTGSAVFTLKGSHGYSILGFAGSKRADGHGRLTLIIARKGASATYSTPATVTPTRLEADLGALGRIAAEIVPSGSKKALHSRCGGEIPEVEPRLYRGTFEFHGEHGYTDAVATEVPEAIELFASVICPRAVGGEESGVGLPGARLRIVARHGDRRESLQLNKNGFRKATLFSATLAERRDGILIERSVHGRRPAAAFDYDPFLRRATVEPPAPFSGSATFRRLATPANRWTGDLAVDFPGEPDVALTGPGFSAGLVHARKRG